MAHPKKGSVVVLVDGRKCDLLADFLPQILSVEAAVV
jgi:hypothetical protein